jgi:hypothetical protein
VRKERSVKDDVRKWATMTKAKTNKDLKKSIPDFLKFCNFIKKHKQIIDTGKLSEWYCKLLFNLRLSDKPNSSYDAIDKNGNKVEIKQRKTKGKMLGGMKIDLSRISYVLYVVLQDDLLPETIYRFDKKHIRQLKNGRASFKWAFDKGKAEIIYKIS